MRLGLLITGVVQGVGFRGFVRRAALARGLSGWVQHGRDGVRLEVQGLTRTVCGFPEHIQRTAPPPALVGGMACELLPDRDELGFEIRECEDEACGVGGLPADLATCAECWNEVTAAGGRRAGYPFTSCAHCGPRYSIALAVPHDRRRTTMRAFEVCEACAAEAAAPDDRRFRAPSLACPACGPQLSWLDAGGRVQAHGAAALTAAVRALASGDIVAVRGVGGFQLLADGTDGAVVGRLRSRQRRPDAPFPVLFRDLEQVVAHASPSAADLRLLDSAAAPIVLLPRRPGSTLAREVCAESTDVAALLPYTPLLRLLMDQLRRPLVCTRGSRQGEPTCIETELAVERLCRIADGFLTHDRPIARPLDDSVVQSAGRAQVVLRRGRGYVPLPVATVEPDQSLLALGAHDPSSVAFAHGGALVLSQPLGDLARPEALELLQGSVEQLCEFFGVRPQRLACDLDPEYGSTRLAERLAERWQVPLVRVQHHHAHVGACIAEHGLEGPVLGLSWDGGGLGSDGHVWGSEALLCRGSAVERVGHLAPFTLPERDGAPREPRRAALGLLAAHLPEALARYAAAWGLPFSPSAPDALHCTSLGGLFEAVAALLGFERRQTYAGQAAGALERWAAEAQPDGAYPLPLGPGADAAPPRAELRPLLEALEADRRSGTVSRQQMARRFHQSLIAFGVALAERAAVEQVALGGSCFQNRLLRDGLAAALRRVGFRVYGPRQVPPNDQGISVGQALILARTVL